MRTDIESVIFTQQEIDIARRLKAAGLGWEPEPGHFVFDEDNVVEAPSPFLENVYFILDLKHFLRRAGTVDDLRRRMCWLPTWEQARALLEANGVDSLTLIETLRDRHALETGVERLVAYEMLLDALASESAA